MKATDRKDLFKIECHQKAPSVSTVDCQVSLLVAPEMNSAKIKNKYENSNPNKRGKYLNNV